MASEASLMLRCQAALASLEAPQDGQSDSDAFERPVGTTGVGTGGAAQKLRPAVAVAALVLLGVTFAAVRLPAHRPTTPAPWPAEGKPLSLLADYEPIDSQALGECTGSILAATLWTANIGLIIRSAVANCPVGELFQEIIDDNIPWFPNGTLKPDNDRRLAESADPETREAFIRMATAKRGALQDLEHTDNETLNECWNTFLKQQHADLKAVCVRDVLEFVSSSAIVAEYGQIAATTCMAKAPFKADCGFAVTGLVNKFPREARFATQMEIRCPKRGHTFDPDIVAFVPDASYDCEGRMEGVAWEISTIGQKMQRALDQCGPVKKKGPKINYGGCVTMTVSAAAYLGASAISLVSAGESDCVNMTQYDMSLAFKAAQGDDDAYERLVNNHHGRGLHCARDIVSSIRTMGLASMKASRAAGFCGGLHTQCGRDIAAAATAFTAAVESFLISVHDCRLKPFHNDGSDIKKRNVQCTAYTASAMKEMSVAAALTMDASESCRETNTAAGVCASSVSKALAAFSYMMERTALAGRNCPVPGVADGSKSYACGQNLEQAGEAVLVATTAIGSATINCGLGMRPSPTKHFGLNRRFWVPR